MSTDQGVPPEPSQVQLRALIAQWRERANEKKGTFHQHSERSIKSMRQCADELEAALAEGVPSAEPGVPGSEVLCEACAKVFCPHGERLHFHHDGCPACGDDEPESARVPPEPSQEQP
jgi:hypothetical protein